MQLQQKHIDALDKAEHLMLRVNYCPYLDLKDLLAQNTTHARQQFRKLFASYYSLNAGGLTDEFKNKYFQILHGGRVFKNGKPRYKTIIIRLNKFKRRKGDYALSLSFVSKLVAVHDETCPIYDRYVLEFFAERVPGADNPRNVRIDWFLEFIAQIKSDYQSWAKVKAVQAILTRLKTRDPQLAKCDAVRLIDFLVWNAGNHQLLK
jgi:hypothetical protein